MAGGRLSQHLKLSLSETLIVKGVSLEGVNRLEGLSTARVCGGTSFLGAAQWGGQGLTLNSPAAGGENF